MSTEVRASDYFAIIPEWVLDADISPNAVRLYAVLNRYANDRGRAWPSRRTLAERLRISPSTVDRAKDELVGIGALTVEARISPAGDPTSNLFTIHIRPVGTVGGSSPMTKGISTRDHRGMVTRDDLNRARRNQSQPSSASPMKRCPECRGSNTDTALLPGLSTVWNAEKRDYQVCERCEGSGRVPR